MVANCQQRKDRPVADLGVLPIHIFTNVFYSQPWLTIRRQHQPSIAVGKFWEATLQLLRDNGAAVSTAQIAAKANCSKETLYNWFGDREGIMLALIAEQAKSIENALEVKEGQIEDRLCVAAARMLDVATGECNTDHQPNGYGEYLSGK